MSFRYTYQCRACVRYKGVSTRSCTDVAIHMPVTVMIDGPRACKRKLQVRQLAGRRVNYKLSSDFTWRARCVLARESSIVSCRDLVNICSVICYKTRNTCCVCHLAGCNVERRINEDDIR